MVSSALSASTIPQGTYFSLHPLSCSLAWLSPRVRPPRENSPIFTVALQSILQRLTLPADPACSSFFYIVEDGIGLFDLLLRFGFHHLAQPKAHPIQHRGHGTGRGQLLLTIALLAQRLQGRLGRQPRVGYARAKRRVLLRMRIGELTKRFSHQRMPLFPAFASTEGSLSPKTKATGSSLRQAKCHGLASPPKDDFGHQRSAPVIFQRHLGFKGTPRRAGHFGGG